MEETFSIINKTKGKVPNLPFAVIARDILGPKYTLSMAFLTPKEMQKINKQYRAKDKPTNVLSFSLSRNEGELLLCPSLIKKESKDKNKNFGKNFEDLLGYLVIHGILHLKGMQHGAIMEVSEKKYDKKYFHRDRRGLFHDASRGGRVFKRRKNS